MKILKRLVVILIILMSILGVKSFASTGKINVSATRLREENNTTSKILTKIYEDEEVDIIENFGEWIKVKYKNYTGYIKKEFVDIKEESKKDETSKENISNYENTDSVVKDTNKTTLLKSSSLRLIPNFMSKQIKQISEGTKVTVVSQMNQWAQVSDGSVTGWVLKNKLDLTTSTTTEVDSSDLDNTNTTNKTNTTNTSSNTTKTNTASNAAKTNTVANITNTKNNTTTNTVKNNTTDKSTITTVSKKGKVNVETANVRKEPSTSAKRIDFLDEGDVVTITEETEGWYKVKHNNIEGYVSKDLITITSENSQISSRSLEEDRQNEVSENKKVENKEESSTENVEVNVSGSSVVEYAKKYLNYPYVVGGKTPEAGFDCSGFTRYVYKNFGYNLSSVSYQQTSVGTEVTREDLQPGDLILFYNEEKTKIGHTGIYIGNGEFIHAANAKRGVVCDNMNTLTYYDERFVTARRIVQ